MALWDLLRRNKKDAFQEYADNMQPLQPQRELPVIQIQEGQNGGAVYSPEQAQLQSQGQAQGAPRRGLRLIDRLFGVQAQPTDSIDTNTMNVTVSNNPRVGGLLNDIGAGARENFATGFAANNLLDNETAGGRRKGFAYRLGEGLGTIGRVLESPLGRGLITAGIVGATGGNGLEALAYGGQAGLLNQNLRNADNLYRQQLKDNYGFTDEQLNQRKGYIDANTFNNLTESQNSAMNLALRQQTTQSMNRLRELQIEKQRIINSTLPEMQKAKLSQENAKAAHAEEMQIARINYYNNAVANPLGWAKFFAGQEAAKDAKAEKANEKIQSEQYNKDLAEYSQIMHGNDAKKVRYARQKFIELYGKDPDKLVEF